MAGYRCLVIGYDGSSSSRRAVTRGVELARLLGVPAYIVTVVQQPALVLGEYLTPSPGEVSRIVKAVREALAKLVSELEAAGYRNVYCDVVEGEPAHALVDYARSRGCGLIVVGRRGASRIDLFVAGSVASKLVTYARGIDVLVVD